MNDLPQPMRSVWHSLLWKEWHEHKWKLAALTAVSVGALIAFDLVAPDSLLSALIGIPTAFCILAGTFLGMSTAGGESGRKTLPFLQSLPIPMWQPGAVKLSMAAVTAILPLLVFIVVFWVWWTFLWFFSIDISQAGIHRFHYHPWGIPNWLAATAAGSALGVSSLLLWMAAMGSNRSDEVRSGAIGFLIICMVWFVLASGLELAEKWHLPTLKYGVKVLFAAAPGGVAFVGIDKQLENHFVWWPHFLAATLGHGCLLAWYLRRFGKVVPGSSRSDGKTLALAGAKYQHLAPPMRSRLTAIAWKQVRETGPLVLMAIGSIFLMTTLAYLFNDRRVSIHEVGQTLSGITMSVGFFVALVAGIGVFLEDLKPRVDDFWRSRPVNYLLWFGVKFVVGAVILITTFGLLMLLAHWLIDRSFLRNAMHPILTAGFFGLVFLLIYTLSMATYCVLRQPLYAAVLTIGLLMGGWIAFLWICHDFFGDSLLSWQTALVLLLLSQVAATVLAWQAVKRNWQIAAI
ncbi:MAG: hypothetical protein GXP26_10860 [Planctomycetes bacterium]|nr:hypothetical protein [Planctomycetota bacterium]